MTWDVERSRGEHLRTLEQIRVSMTVRRQAAIREIEQVGGESIHLRGWSRWSTNRPWAYPFAGMSVQ